MTPRLVILFWCLIAAFAAVAANPHLAVVARKNVAAGGGVATIFSEDFDDPGFENVWTEQDVHNAVHVTNTVAYTGSYSLFVNGADVEGTNHYIYIDAFGASSGLTNFYARMAVYFPGSPTGSPDGGATIDDNGTSVGARDNGGIFINDADRVSYYLYTDVGTTAYKDFQSTGQWYRIEWHYPTGIYKVDGVSGTNTADASLNQARNIIVGGSTFAGQNADFYIDGIAVSTNDWIGAPE